MSRHLNFKLLVGCLLLGTVAARSAELEIGAAMPLPDQAMTNIDGKQVALKDIKGEKGTVVFFWCNTCPWVHKWRTRMVELAREYSQQGFGFVAVNPNDPGKSRGDSMEAMKKEAETHSYGFPYVVDEGSKLAGAFGATRTPHVYVFGADDKLVYVGAIDDNANDADKVDQPYLRKVLDAVSRGEKTAITHSKALGCTIKWYK